MSQNDYIPSTDEGKAALFERFRDTVPNYIAPLGLTAPELLSQFEDATWFRYALNYTLIVRDRSQQWTNYKNSLLVGTGPIDYPPYPTAPTTEPPSVTLGVLTRFRELARRIKAAPGYTEGIGEALGIVGPETTPPDLSTLAPEISLKIISGKVDVIWNKRGMPAVEIQKDSGSGWQMLAIDTRPDYTDTTAFPTPPAKWRYRATYCEGSERLGNWSNIAEITVGG
jgi:hypothetical protein